MIGCYEYSSLILPIFSLALGDNYLAVDGPTRQQTFPTPILKAILKTSTFDVQSQRRQAWSIPASLFLRIRGDWTSPRIREPCVAVVPSDVPCHQATFRNQKELLHKVSGPTPVAKVMSSSGLPINSGSIGHAFIGTPEIKPSFTPVPQSSLNNSLRCAATVLWHESNLEEFLEVEVERPLFTYSDNPVAGTVCYREANTEPFALGELLYYPLPSVKFLAGVVSISVRSFLNPGWYQEIHLQCANCTDLNRLVVQEIKFQTNCTTFKARDARGKKHHVRAQPHCTRTSLGPCEGYADSEAFQIVSPSDISNGVARFQMKSQRRLLASERHHHFRHRSALCLYTDDAAPKGVLVGYAQLRMDRADVNAFVAFVCFFGVALPLICMVTILLHANKIRRCKLQINHLRTEYQRTQLEQELITRNEHLDDDTQG